jgi:Predicted membrane protein involved in D-alanine export
MVLTSFSYIAFLFLLLFVYYVVPKKIQWVILLIFSMIFIGYSVSSVSIFFFLLYSLVVSYAGSLIIYKLKSPIKKRNALIIVIILLVVQLLLLKYSILIQNLSGGLFKISSFKKYVAPIGISFYTLIMLGNIIDVYRMAYVPQKNILKHTLFVFFFPHMISGPITRYSDLKEQLFVGHKFDYVKVTFGLQRVIWGFFKKLVISERLSVLVNTVYGDTITYQGFYIIFATICFAFQLYTDFSGCMDIVIGSAEALDIKMPENFQTPFFSQTISEYWRRWHITLGTWMKDYIFYPLLKSNFFQSIQRFATSKIGKKWGKKIPVYLGMIILWTFVGAWHGGAYNYIFGSGILHCFYIISGELLSPFFDKIAKIFHINQKNFSFKIFRIIRTFILVCIGLLFFRSLSFSVAVTNFIRIFATFNIWIFFDKSLYNLGLDEMDFRIGIIALLLLFAGSLLQQKYRIREKLAEQNIIFRWILLYALLFAILIFGFYGGGYDPSAFIYGNF